MITTDKSGGDGCGVSAGDRFAVPQSCNVQQCEQATNNV